MNIIEDIRLDLDRCEKVLSEKNYLEIVIAIEELQDKYRNVIKEISENCNNVVWNYSAKDLENIKKHLIKYKEELILKEKLENIEQKISEIKLYIENNNIENKTILIEMLNNIENVNNKDISLEDKYEELKSYLNYIKSFERQIAIYLLELITLIIK